MQGTVAALNRDKGFGFVAAEGADSDLFFHLSDIVPDDRTRLSKGANVEFDPTEDDQGRARAHNVRAVRGDRVEGIVKWFRDDLGYGFIVGPADVEYYANRDAIVQVGYKYLAEGERVAFEPGRQRDGKSCALWITAAPDRLEGSVCEFDHQKGWGFVQTADGGTRCFLHYTEILATRGKRTADVGELVTFDSEPGGKGPQAKRVKRLDPRLPLFRFATMGDEAVWLADLAGIADAEPGDWEYSNLTPTNETESARPKPILWSYVVYTFARLQEQNRESSQHIALATDKGRQYACFNTGLITPLQEEIFAIFEEDRRADEHGTSWNLVGFRSASHFDLTRFANLPRLANYFDDPTLLLYDRRLELQMDVEHIVQDNLHRFPAFVDNNSHIARQLLNSAHADTSQRVYRNYKTAIPQYYRGGIQLLLPLCLERKDRADLALVVTRHNDTYRGETVLTLDMAYKNARLLTRPDDEWLHP